MKAMSVQWEGQEGYELVKKWLKSIVLSPHSVMIERLRPNYAKQTSAYQDKVTRFAMEQ